MSEGSKGTPRKSPRPSPRAHHHNDDHDHHDERRPILTGHEHGHHEAFETTAQRQKDLAKLEEARHTVQDTCCGGLWQELRIIDEEIDTNRHMTWSELFYDLIFVTGVGKVGDGMKTGDLPIYVYCMYLLVIFGMWHSATTFGCRFHRGDLSNKIYFALHMLGMVFICMNIPSSYCFSKWVDCQKSAPNGKALAYSFAFVHIVEIIGFIRIGYQYYSKGSSPTEKATTFRMVRQCLRRCIEQLIPLVCWCLLASSVIDPHYAMWVFAVDLLTNGDNFIIWTLLQGINFPFERLCGCEIIPQDAFSNLALMPLHMDHYCERLGLVILIVLGETVDGIAVHGYVITASLYGTVIFAYLVVFSMKLLYFDTMIAEEETHCLFNEAHADIHTQDPNAPLNDDKERIRIERVLRPGLKSSLWIFFHQTLAVSLAMTGDALALVCEGAAEANRANHVRTFKTDVILTEGGPDMMAMALTGDGDSSGESSPNAREVLSWAVGLSFLMIGYVGFAHKQKSSLEENKERGLAATFFLLECLQVASIIFAAVISICMQYFSEDELSNVAMLTIQAFCGIFIAALSYVDECVENNARKDEFVHEIDEEEEKLIHTTTTDDDTAAEGTFTGEPVDELLVTDVKDALKGHSGPIVAELLKILERSENCLTAKTLAKVVSELPANQLTTPVDPSTEA